MNWLLLNSGRCPPALNMAMDEALLEAMPRLCQPVLRFYGWTEPGATFGYFQKFTEVEQTTLLRPLMRRPTGGGVVPHDADWTYSVGFPVGSEWYSLRAEESYRRMHEWIQTAFARLGVETELAPCCKQSAPGQCFVGHEKYDLLWQGRKIAGAAQRRNKLGLLIQGSVQPPPVTQARADWERAMAESVEPQPQWVEFAPDEPLQARVAELVTNKYSKSGYNQKR
jgi:lipoate-protein ligase A